MKRKMITLGSKVCALVALFAAVPANASDTTALLEKECQRVYEVYPRLMLAVMLEGELNCADPHSGEYVSCNEGETAEEKAARERRIVIRKHQENSYAPAEDACRTWDENKKSTAHQLEALEAIKNARMADKWRPEKSVE